MPKKCRLASTVEKIKVSINLFQNIFSIDLFPKLLIWYEEKYNKHENQTDHFDKSWQQWQSLWTTLTPCHKPLGFSFAWLENSLLIQLFLFIFECSLSSIPFNISNTPSFRPWKKSNKSSNSLLFERLHSTLTHYSKIN